MKAVGGVLQKFVKEGAKARRRNYFTVSGAKKEFDELRAYINVHERVIKRYIDDLVQYRAEVEVLNDMLNWREGARKRSERTKLREKGIRIAEERVRRHPGLIGYMPGAFVTNEKNMRFVEQAGSFRMVTRDGSVVAIDASLSHVSPKSKSDKFDTKDFTFTVTNSDGKKTDYSINVATLSRPRKNFTSKDIYLFTSILTTPLNLDGHPKAADKSFVESVRKYELGRLLDMATYTGSYSWDSSEFRSNLFREIWPYYRDAKNKSIFLNTLLNNLRRYSPVSGGAFSSTYGTILDHMQRKY